MSEFTHMSTPVYELSAEESVAGRRQIKVILHEIHPDENHYQDNGISWNEDYVIRNMKSVSGMSLVAEFLTDDRDVPYGHGMTDVQGTLPVFEDATVVGHFERAYVDNVELNGEVKRVLIADGVLDEMRYPKFISWLREHMEMNTVRGSVEIVGKLENDGHIIYSDGWKEHGRVPKDYDYSGYAILGVEPADKAAVVLELNNKSNDKEDDVMDEFKEEMAAVKDSLNELNVNMQMYFAQLDAKNAEIEQLKADIAQREADIAQLNAALADAQAKEQAMIAGMSEVNEKLDAANSRVKELEDMKAVSELNAALADYTEEQCAVAQEDINQFNENPGCIEINTIVGKICTEMVRVSRIPRDSDIDVFSLVDTPEENEVEVNVF